MIATLLGGLFVFLLVAPRLAPRFLEPVTGARSLVWLNLGWLLAVGAVVVAALVIVLLRFMPRPIMQAFGITCTDSGSCVTLVPIWAQWGLFAGALAVLTMFAVLAIHSAWSGTAAMICARRVARLAGHPFSARSFDGELGSERLLLIEAPGTFAFTVGLWRPEIVLSKNIIEALSPEQLEAVVAHESAHVAGRDNIILLVARTVTRSLWFLPGVRTAHRRLRRAMELAADDQARDHMGEGLIVAESLHRFASLMTHRTFTRGRVRNPVLAWFAEEGLIVERIGWLLDESEPEVSRRRVRLAFVGLAIATLALGWGTFRVSDVHLNLGAHPAGCTGSVACHSATS